MVATTHQNTMVSPAMPQRQMAHPGSDLSVAGALHLAGVRLDSLKREASIGGCAANVWQAKAALCLCLHGSSVPTFCQHGSTCYCNPMSLPALSQYDWGHNLVGFSGQRSQGFLMQQQQRHHLDLAKQPQNDGRLERLDRCPR